MTCFHFLRRLMSEMQYLLTLIFFAISFCGTPSTKSLFISRTSSSHSLAFPFLEPVRRPLRAASVALSLLVPTKRCSGLKHVGLSQVWQTCFLSLSLIPKKQCADKRCARKSFLQNVSFPYPSLSLNPVQFQQSVCGSISRLKYSLNVMSSFVNPLPITVLEFKSPFLLHLA